MTIEGSITALITFMLINSITPGPNNIMLLQAGLQKGYWGCVQHMLGIAFGVAIMLWLSYWGMATFIVQIPTLMLIVKIMGTGYLLWLTFTVANMDLESTISNALEIDNPEEKSSQHTSQTKISFGELPLTFGQATLFQWLNPKAWTMTMVAPSIVMVASNRPWLDNLPLILMCAIINLLCMSSWTVGGLWLRKLVRYSLVMRIVHILIVLMTLYCALGMWL